jgi:hypothetical protein
VSNIACLFGCHDMTHTVSLKHKKTIVSKKNSLCKQKRFDSAILGEIKTPYFSWYLRIN